MNWVPVTNLLFAPSTQSSFAYGALHGASSSLFGRRSLRGVRPSTYLFKMKNALKNKSVYFGGEEGRTPVREGKPGTSTGLVMRGGCREPVAA